VGLFASFVIFLYCCIRWSLTLIIASKTIECNHVKLINEASMRWPYAPHIILWIFAYQIRRKYVWWIYVYRS